MILPHMSLYCKLVPVQYREYDINLFLMILPHMSLHCKLVPVQYQEYDINLFLMILPHMSLHYKLVPVHYRKYEYGLFPLKLFSQGLSTLAFKAFIYISRKHLVERHSKKNQIHVTLGSFCLNGHT